jgi:hypothetical protein
VATESWDLVGQRLGSYQTEEVIVVGASSRVYRARHLALDAPRVIKVLRLAALGDRSKTMQPEYVVRTLHLSERSHPHKVPDGL